MLGSKPTLSRWRQRGSPFLSTWDNVRTHRSYLGLVFQRKIPKVWASCVHAGAKMGGQLPIVFVFKLLLYLLYIVFVFVAWCICLVHHAPPRSGGRAKCSVVEALVGTRGGILLTTHLLSSSLSPHSCLVRRQNQRWSPCAGRQVISQPGTTLDFTMHVIRMFLLQ